jgi:hypothetical protein
MGLESASLTTRSVAASWPAATRGARLLQRLLPARAGTTDRPLQPRANAGTGVDRPLPRARETPEFRRYTLHGVQAHILGAVLQQLSRKNPVTGWSEQEASGSPNTFNLASIAPFLSSTTA